MFSLFFVFLYRWDVYEAPEEKRLHVARFVRAVRMAPHKTAILVGHSLCFRAMMEAFAGPGVDVQFKKKKLVNCGVMAVDFDFAYAAAEEGDEGSTGDGGISSSLPPGDNGCQPIRAARLMFGSTFHGDN